jgi:ribulose-5-phosphate 4-epimerase/fuculose-1-phosphate aldolase
MTIDEGYVKYQSFWTKAPAPHAAAAEQLETWRQPLFAAGLIGEYKEHGIGYGNISVRCGGPGQFMISGTQTGHLARTDKSHYALVTSWSVHNNLVCCVGLVQASSEAMTHAAIYQLDQRIGAIVHVHSRDLWNHYLNSLPTTAPDVPYGTPQMANEFRRLYRDTDFRRTRLAVMAGHEEGIVSIGSSLEDAATRVLQLCPPSG